MSSAATTLNCYHCGDPCRSEHVDADGHDFCCSGCRAVYSLLQESGLSTYYELEKRPGTKVGPAQSDEWRSEVFDIPQVQDRLISFREGGMARVTFTVPQMHCSSCIWLLENLDRVEPAIMRSRVRFGEKSLSITYRDDHIGLRGVVELLRRIGYGPRIVNGEEDAGKRRIPRDLYVRLGVAAFAFGNIMLFSFPEYLGATDQDHTLRRGFQWLSLVFALPVVLYAAAGFFRSAWTGIRAGTTNIDQPIALGIIALFGRSLYEVVSGVGPGYFDSLAGLVFFLLVGHWYRSFVYGSLSFDRSLNDFLPLVVMRKRGQQEEAVRVDELDVGDQLIVRDQELVPVDGLLIDGPASIDNSFITGEPLPVIKVPGDQIAAGGRQRGGSITVQVVRTFKESQLKRLWEEHGSNESDRPVMGRLVDKVARRFIFFVLAVAGASGLFWAGRDPAMVLPVITAVLIVACPCALALSMPFTYGHVTRLLGKRGLFLREAEVVERMADVDTLVLDKTGTLTEREAHVLRFTGPPLSASEQSRIRSLVAQSAHPLSQAIYQGSNATLCTVSDFKEHAGSGLEGVVDGCRVRMGSHAFVDVDERHEGQVQVLMDGIHRGAFLIAKRPRPGMQAVLRALGRRYPLHLLTGDVSVDQEVAECFDRERTHVRCTPAMKASTVERMGSEGKRVMMVGDGLNDAGALHRSHVGVTLCESTVALTPASDAILDAGRSDLLPGALLLARKARSIVFTSLVLSLLYNVIGLSYAVTGALTPLIAAILMPLSSVTVVGFVTMAVRYAASRSLPDDRQDGR
ncbi:MAG: heavy metal translocating P-type ATPase metal-binding domain-containing protein [Flavobacteriales bacterium]|nr:heavy metal translocating P-type ATPase metal-binding domain-containing protein [Flavobacteriales bacterium]